MSNPYQSPASVSAATSDIEKGRLIAEFNQGWFLRIFWLLAGIFLLLMAIPFCILLAVKATHPAIYIGVAGIAFVAAAGFFGCVNNVLQRVRLYETGIEFAQGPRKFIPWDQVGEVVVSFRIDVKLIDGKTHHHHQRLYWSKRKRFGEVLRELRVANEIKKYLF